MEISEPDQWSSGDVAILQNKEAKRVREIGSLIIDTRLQHDYYAGVEVRSLLSTEVMEEIDGRLAVIDVDSNQNRFVKVGSMTFQVAPQRGNLLTIPLKNMLQLGVPNAFQLRFLHFLSLVEGAQGSGSHAHLKG